jgi:hypothetical protein
MCYLVMIPPTDPQKRIAYIQELIARTEERLRKLRTRAKPGTARMVHALTNSVRKYRRDLRNLLALRPNLTNQKFQQQMQMHQAQSNARGARSGELPAKQDQEPGKPASQQATVAGQ